MTSFLRDNRHDDDGASISGPRVALVFAVVGIVLGMVVGPWWVGVKP